MAETIQTIHEAATAAPRKGRSRQWLAWSALLLASLTLVAPVTAQEASNQPLSVKLPDSLAGGPQAWTSPAGLSSTIQVMLLLTVLSLAPAVLLMTTCFVRIIVVLGLLRQALGTQSLPPTQVITALALFITLLVMTPVGSRFTTGRSSPIPSASSRWNRPGRLGPLPSGAS